jgi:hypothetical protein
MPDQPEAGTPVPTAQPVGNAPAAAGTLTPQEPTGQIEAGKLDVYHARKLLERAVSKFGVNSPEGEKALRSLGSLTKDFGDHEDTDEQFSPAELKRMLASLAGPGATGGPPPQQAQPPPPGTPPPQQ